MNTTQALFFSTLETLYMVGVAGLISVLIGLPLGVYLFINSQPHFNPHKTTHTCVSICINTARSIPFIILMVAILPLTRIIVGTGIGTTASIVPLSLAAIPFFARITESALKNLPTGLIETGVAMGANTRQIIVRVLLPESAADLIRGATLMLITLIGYSAMAGAIGGGGLGSLAIQYGYQRFETSIMVSTIVILIALVQLLQWGGDRLAKLITH